MTESSLQVCIRVRPANREFTHSLFGKSGQLRSRSTSRAEGETFDENKSRRLSATGDAACLSVGLNSVTLFPSTSSLNRFGRHSDNAVAHQGQEPFRRVHSASTAQNRGGEATCQEFRGFARCFSSQKHDEAYASQQQIYEEVGQSALESLLDGYNSCIMAYGQTGSGKTYTMLGPHWDEITRHWSPERDVERLHKYRLMDQLKKSDERGLTLRICAQLFDRLKQLKREGFQPDVTVTYYQIYLEKVTCLIEPKTPVEVRQNSQGHYVKDIKAHKVSSFEEVVELLKVGTKNRLTSETIHNQNSSRSHAVFRISLKLMGRHNAPTHSVMNLVDLAGSEQLAGTNMSEKRRKETTNINLSLSVLNRVINSLAQGHKHIPYRESVLTRLLRHSLGGNSKTIFLATVSPDQKDRNESASTLRYAGKARLIKTVVSKNVVNYTNKLKALEAEIADFRAKGENVDELLYEMELIKEEKLRFEKLYETYKELYHSTHEKLILLESAALVTPRQVHEEEPIYPIRRGAQDTPFVRRSQFRNPDPPGLSPMQIAENPYAGYDGSGEEEDERTKLKNTPYQRHTSAPAKAVSFITPSRAPVSEPHQRQETARPEEVGSREGPVVPEIKLPLSPETERHYWGKLLEKEPDFEYNDELRRKMDKCGFDPFLRGRYVGNNKHWLEYLDVLRQEQPTQQRLKEVRARSASLVSRRLSLAPSQSQDRYVVSQRDENVAPLAHQQQQHQQQRASSTCSSVVGRPTQLSFENQVERHFDAAMQRIDSPNPTHTGRRPYLAPQQQFTRVGRPANAAPPAGGIPIRRYPVYKA